VLNAAHEGIKTHADSRSDPQAAQKTATNGSPQQTPAKELGREVGRSLASCRN